MNEQNHDNDALTALREAGIDIGAAAIMKPTLAETLIPIDLCDVPGVIHDHIEYTMSIAKYPNRRTAFVGALAFMSFAAGRRYRTEDNTRTNLYLVAAANSGAGKDAPRKTNQMLALSCGALNCVADAVASGEGLEDFVIKNAKGMLQSDEFDTLIRAINEDRGGTKESLVRVLLTTFTSSCGVMQRRRTSMSTDRGASNAEKYCVHPSLTLFGSCVTRQLYSAINERVMSNGLLARCLIVDCGTRQPRGSAKYADPPQRMVDTYRRIFGSVPKDADSWELPDKPDRKRTTDDDVIRCTDDASALLNCLEDEWDAKYHSYDRDADESADAWQSVAARIGEQVTKCAMIYAISESEGYHPVITVQAVKWANEFVKYCNDAMKESAKRYYAVSEFDSLMKRVLRKFEKKDTLTKREIYRCLRASSNDVEQVIEALRMNGEIVETEDGKYTLP